MPGRSPVAVFSLASGRTSLKGWRQRVFCGVMASTAAYR